MLKDLIKFIFFIAPCSLLTGANYIIFEDQEIVDVEFTSYSKSDINKTVRATAVLEERSLNNDNKFI